jgi:hypothetical protein
VNADTHRIVALVAEGDHELAFAPGCQSMGPRVNLQLVEGADINPEMLGTTDLRVG